MEHNEAFIEVLRYGSNNHDVDPQTLVDHLNKKELYFSSGNPSTINTAPFQNIFRANYRSGAGSKPVFNSGELYMLTQEAMAFLLNYDAFQLSKTSFSESQQTALRAIKYAKLSIWMFAGLKRYLYRYFLPIKLKISHPS